MKFMLLVWICTMLWYSCNTKTPEQCTFTVINNSATYIDSMKITANGMEGAIFNLAPKLKVEKTFPIKPKGSYEGAFLASIFVKGSAKNRITFGYYYSPSAIKQHYVIEILPDFTLREH